MLIGGKGYSSVGSGRVGKEQAHARRRHSPYLGPRTFRGGRAKSLRGGPAGGLLLAHPRGHSRPYDCNMHLAGRVGRGGKRTGRVGGRRVQRERILRDGGRRNARQLELFASFDGTKVPRVNDWAAAISLRPFLCPYSPKECVEQE